MIRYYVEFPSEKIRIKVYVIKPNATHSFFKVEVHFVIGIHVITCLDGKVKWFIDIFLCSYWFVSQQDFTSFKSLMELFTVNMLDFFSQRTKFGEFI